MKRNTATKLKGKFDKGDILEHVARLLRAGHTYAEAGRLMKDRFGVEISHTMVCKYAQEIEAKYEKAAVDTRMGHKAEQVMGIMDVYREAHEAWERSKENSVKKVKEVPAERPCGKCKGSGKMPPELSRNTNRKNPAFPQKCDWCNGKGSYKPTGDVTVTVAGRLPDNAYLRTMLDCRTRILEIYGLIDRRPVDKSTNTVNVGDAAVQEFFAQLIGGAAPQPALDRLMAVESGKLPPVPIPPVPVKDLPPLEDV